jgi:hypothetical protein
MKIAADLMKIANLQLGVSFKYRRSSGLKVSTQQEYASRWSTVQTQSSEYVQAFIYPLKALT